MLFYLDFHAYIFRKKNASLLIKLPLVKDTWLLNCTEGVQFNFLSHGLKINNLLQIIIPELHILSISGLMGLLSTLNLTGRNKPLHIYAPFGLKSYLNFGKKYSRTNFSYVIYIHVLDNGIIIDQNDYCLYALKYHKLYEFLIVKSEVYGTFDLTKAKNNNLIPGPIYSRLKQGCTFLAPDGSIMDGYCLTSCNTLGFQMSCISSYFYRKNFFKVLDNNNFTLFF